MICPHCNQTHPDGVRFCPMTGKMIPPPPVEADAAAPEPESPPTELELPAVPAEAESPPTVLELSAPDTAEAPPTEIEQPPAPAEQESPPTEVEIPPTMLPEAEKTVVEAVPAVQMVPCVHCQEFMRAGLEVCPFCGAKQDEPPPPVEPVPPDRSAYPGLETAAYGVPETLGGEPLLTGCVNCGKEIRSGLKFCPFCGAAQGAAPLPPPPEDTAPPTTLVRCVNCGREIRLGLKFCPACGAAQEVTPPPPPRPFPWLAVGAGLLGLIGVVVLLFWWLNRQDGNTADLPAVGQALSGTVTPLPPAGLEDGDAPRVGAGVVLPSPTPLPSATFPPTQTFTPAPTQTASPTPTPTPTFTSTATPVYLPINAADGMALVLIPRGEFLMGSDPATDPYFYGSEGPSHTVTLNEYYIYQTEVTNAMYALCVADQACPRPARNESNTRSEYYGNPAFDNYPVVYVSWVHAVSYCRWAGGRLPTEAEWEKAARGTDGRLFPWGNQKAAPDLAQYGVSDTAAVGSYPAGASPFGVLDMAGNVIEWTQDYFQSLYYQNSPDTNPLGPASGTTRVYRGGAYHNLDEALRVVTRGSRAESHTNVDIGFRCVVDTP